MKDISRGVGTLQHMLGFAVVCYAVVITANHNWYVGADNQNLLISWSSFSVSSTFGTEWSHPESSHCHCWMTRFCKNEKWWKWWLFYQHPGSESGVYFTTTLKVKVKEVTILSAPWKVVAISEHTAGCFRSCWLAMLPCWNCHSWWHWRWISSSSMISHSIIQ